MTVKSRSAGPSALDLLEEAAHLVRCVPLSAAAAYALGVVPFVLGLTFFIADMSRGPHAAVRLPGLALALTAAFAWMKVWQAVAAEHALATLEQRSPNVPGFRAWIRLLLHQFAIHGFSVLVLPMASLLALPFGWVYAYYQSVTVLALSEGDRAHRVAVEQARLWPGQNHGALGAVFIFGVLVLGNVGVAVYVVPWLVRTLTGTDQVFAQTGWNPFNTTFLAAVVALTFLVLDPVIKAFYVLRCFYGRSRRTGVDLLVQVRAAMGRTAVVMAAVLALAGAAADLRAGEAAADEVAVERPDVPAPTVSPQQLDRALDRVLEKPDYTWREPVPKSDGAAADVARWVRSVREAISRWWKSLFDSEEAGDTVPDSGGWFAPGASTLLWGVMILALVLVAAVVVTILKRSEAAALPLVGPLPVKVALEHDDLTADQLEEDEWLRLARESIARGEVRLGMRALFLGSLAGLAGRGLLVLARHKSNRDYERELARRGLPTQLLAAAFTQNRREFEGVWYGNRTPSLETLARFEENVRVLIRKEAA